MMSQYAEEIISVVRELKEIILTKLDNGEEVSTEELDGFTREAFQKTNIQFGVKESTVRDKCTRQIEVTTKEFYKLVSDYLLGLNKDLEDKVVDYCKFSDDPANIRAELQKI